MAVRHNYKEDFKELQKRESNIEVISKQNKRDGLCADCVRAESCSLSLNDESIIWDCEDYQNEDVEPMAARSSEISTPMMSEKADSSQSQSNPGLCAFCTYSETCSIKNIDGGVWHCEEYA